MLLLLVEISITQSLLPKKHAKLIERIHTKEEWKESGKENGVKIFMELSSLFELEREREDFVIYTVFNFFSIIFFSLSLDVVNVNTYNLIGFGK